MVAKSTVTGDQGIDDWFPELSHQHKRLLRYTHLEQED